MKKNILTILFVLMFSLNTFAVPEGQEYLIRLETQISVAQKNLVKSVRKAQRATQNLDLPEDYQTKAISDLAKMTNGFLANLDSECFVQAISNGAVGGSALAADISLCKIAKINAKTAAIQALTKSMLM